MFGKYFKFYTFIPPRICPEDIYKTTCLSPIIGLKAIGGTLKINGTELSVERWVSQTVSVWWFGHREYRYICYLPAGLGLRPRAVFETSTKECLLIISFLLSETGVISCDSIPCS
jgi:hypothetical protein